MEHKLKMQADDAFDYAIDNGCLSSNPDYDNYAGKFMYMGKQDGKYAFKRIDTREYKFCI